MSVQFSPKSTCDKIAQPQRYVITTAVKRIEVLSFAIVVPVTAETTEGLGSEASGGDDDAKKWKLLQYYSRAEEKVFFRRNSFVCNKPFPILLDERMKVGPFADEHVCSLRLS